MEKTFYFLAVALMLATFSSCNTGQEKVSPVQKTDISEFFGQWTIDIEGGSVGWIEVRQDQGFIAGDILWGGGSVLPVSNIFLASDRTLVLQRAGSVVRKRDENRNPLVTSVITDWLEINRKTSDELEGILLRPQRTGLGVDTTFFSGWKLPPVPPAPDLSKVKYGEPETLFNGRDLTGWRLINPEQTNGWKVVDGTLLNDPVQAEGGPRISYGNLRTDKTFGDFNLKLEVNIPPGSNSGVYLRGIYEIQVVDSYKKDTDPHNMGAVYSRIRPVTAAEKPAGQWQTMDMTLCDRHITVILNDVKIIDNQPVYGPTGGAISPDVFAPGPVYLQGDHGKVAYRNIVLTPILE